MRVSFFFVSGDNWNMFAVASIYVSCGQKSGLLLFREDFLMLFFLVTFEQSVRSKCRFF